MLHLTVQGYSSVFPSFNALELLSLYMQIPLLIILYVVRQYLVGSEHRGGGYWLVNVDTVDLTVDEYHENPVDVEVVISPTHSRQHSYSRARSRAHSRAASMGRRNSNAHGYEDEEEEGEEEDRSARQKLKGLVNGVYEALL